jgi:hypothetical protein
MLRGMAHVHIPRESAFEQARVGDRVTTPSPTSPVVYTEEVWAHRPLGLQFVMVGRHAEEIRAQRALGTRGAKRFCRQVRSHRDGRCPAGRL